MSSLYAHPQLDERLGDCGAADRFVRIGPHTMEIIVSVCAVTADRGIVCHRLSVDACNADGERLWGWDLALYPWSHLPHCESDAELVARRLKIAYRKADPQVGWITHWDPEHRIVVPTPRSTDLQIG